MIHSTAIIDPSSEIDPSTEIGAYVIIGPHVKIGSDCSIEPHAQICSSVNIGNNNSIGRGAIIGADPQDLSFKKSTPSKVIIGNGNTIRELVTIHRSIMDGGATLIGDNNFLMTGCHLGHDVSLNNHNVVANACLLGGHVSVGDRVFLGGGAVFHQFVNIGNIAMVQGNSTITQDVPPYCTAHGRNCLSGINIIGLQRSGIDGTLIKEIKRLYKCLFKSDEPFSKVIETLNQREFPEGIVILLKALNNPSRKGICHPSKNR
ncbi:MAG: acyl-ACP--UDP-N-acetylglucosamine O-acyltransferase [Verrucomicrobiales bacterium]